MIPESVENMCKCGEIQYSIMDKSYLMLFGHCWGCDRKRWVAGELSLKDFEAREAQALRGPWIKT